MIVRLCDLTGRELVSVLGCEYRVKLTETKIILERLYGVAGGRRVGFDLWNMKYGRKCKMKVTLIGSVGGCVATEISQKQKKNPRQKLSDEETASVHEIYEKTKSLSETANRFNVTPQRIHQIVNYYKKAGKNQDLIFQ